ncbi:MAG TPA: hypothetical protein PK014_13785 [Thermoanaerobaculia bacterium]|nr:hypothetical protein [Thermoanaerobaculia bacterium]HUM31111.1 hypothetical protein [Thermoanaerobaculia bacterium]HXK69467.1 hypothetical protein [Thermoanaerobaculia bacterium]
MKRFLLLLVMGLILFCMGAKSQETRADRLVLAVHDYLVVLDSTVDRDRLTLIERTKLDRAKRELETLYREVKYRR